MVAKKPRKPSPLLQQRLKITDLRILEMNEKIDALGHAQNRLIADMQSTIQGRMDARLDGIYAAVVRWMKMLAHGEEALLAERQAAEREQKEAGDKFLGNEQ